MRVPVRYLLVPFMAVAQPALPASSLSACAAIPEDPARLACYDSIARQDAPAGTAKRPTVLVPPPPGTLEESWELAPAARRGVLQILPYRPVYGLLHATSDRNTTPSSPTRTLAREDALDLDDVEAKIQLSFKTKLAEGLFGTAADLWFGYTQVSYWQFSNRRASSPFRTTDYEPEAMLVHPLPLDIGGLRLRMVGLSFDHQSNGRSGSLSRSWNRLIGEVAAEAGPWSLHLRPWARVFERSNESNDNPDIEDYVGRGELVAVRRSGKNVLTLTGRHSLRGGERSRGSLRVDYAVPLAGAVNLHLQAFTGYGENLLDYNHRQTTIGVGFSFLD